MQQPVAIPFSGPKELLSKVAGTRGTAGAQTTSYQDALGAK